MGLDEIFKEVFGGIEEKVRQRAEEPVPRTDDNDETGIGGVMRAVVQVVALRQGFLGGMSNAWTGSGSIVHPSGLILTNCHVASPRSMGMSSPPADRLGIAITERSDSPPAVSYFANVVAESPELDLAVLKIVADVRGNRVGNLDLPSVDIGDSDQLQLGDRLAIFGYPGIGGETVTYTSGNVSGFSRERNVSRAWIKTDATIAGGNSGGTGVNQNGELVGIPTQAAAGTGITPVDARPVLDTNRDGRVDQRDTPMAVGGFINGLRPVNLAIPLLEKVGMRIERERSGRMKRGSIMPGNNDIFDRRRAEKPEFREVLFSTRITDDGRPINPTTHVRRGNDTIYATFEHENVAPGTPWSVVWMTDGNVIIEQDDKWDDPEDGRKVVKVSNRKGLPEGEYHLVLGIAGSIALEGKVIVGNPVDESDTQVSGQLVDESTGRGIGNGIVVVLRPEASLREFLKYRSEALVFTSTRTESDGSFTLPEQLPKGQAYSLVAAANGFEPVSVEGALRISSGAPENSNLGSIPLSRA